MSKMLHFHSLKKNPLKRNEAEVHDTFEDITKGKRSDN